VCAFLDAALGIAAPEPAPEAGSPAGASGAEDAAAEPPRAYAERVDAHALVRRPDMPFFAASTGALRSIDLGVGMSLPCVPLLAVYGYAYLPCTPLALLVWRDVDPARLGALGPLDWGRDAGRWPLDVFWILHSAPVRQECQKFRCSNTNEVNVMLHMWANEGVFELLDESVAVNYRVPVGVFDTGLSAPSHVRPVHQDLVDAGVRFGRLEERSVVIHDTCFSPENAMLQLVDGDAVRTHSFCTAAAWSGRRALAVHVLPNRDAVERAAAAVVDQVQAAPELVPALQAGGFDLEAADLAALLERLCESRADLGPGPGPG